jgi:hypothetical protein
MCYLSNKCKPQTFIYFTLFTTHCGQNSVERLFTISNIQTAKKCKGELLALLTKIKPLPEPIFRSRQINRMILHINNSELPVQALLDSASSLPILSKFFATHYAIKFFIRIEQLEVQTFARNLCSVIGTESL